MSDTNFHKKILKSGPSFNSTCWTEIISAGEGDAESLNEFCQQYWHPLYSYARKFGKSSEESQDLTQSFFASFLEKDKLREIEKGKGRFRNFILILFKRFMINEYSKSMAAKRGGEYAKIDFSEVEEWVATQSLSPDDLYNKSWALTTLEQVMDDLEQRFKEKGEEERFRIMKPYLDNSSEQTYKVSSEQLGCSENSFKVAIHRLKKEFGKVLRLKIQSTLDNSSDIDDELRFLSEVLKK
ncbi:MAG: sigma-70 family RNA polymerase sigma factor [Lentisphaeraceae bacterium]|nr:sigma-70 family RNA polymerase sigma factor [Lentisphaeraceae bacterium]